MNDEMQGTKLQNQGAYASMSATSSVSHLEAIRAASERTAENTHDMVIQQNITNNLETENYKVILDLSHSLKSKFNIGKTADMQPVTVGIINE